jgi:gliding motility-associated-like protein
MAFTGIEVSQPEKIDIQSSIIPSGCFANSAYGQVDVTVNGGTAPYNYSWDNNATTQDINNLPTGNYFVVVTDANGCVATKVNIVPQSPAIDLTGIANNASCSQVDNGNIELNIAGGVPSFTIAWSNGETTERISGLAPGTYSVTVTDLSHCSAQTNFTLTTDYELSVSVGNNADALITGQATNLTAVANVDHNNVYTWESVEDMTCTVCATTTIKPKATAAYTVTVLDANGCSATDMVTVEVKDIQEIFIPNAFTPNNDANNDVFKVYGDMSTIALLDLKIFNRWGEKVYETNDIDFAWDGTYKGEYVDRGVYTYTLKIVYVNGVSNDLYKGSITVLR